MTESLNKPCPYCAEDILAAAIKCKHCGERLDQPQRLGDEDVLPGVERAWNPGVAAVLSLVIPGAGQMYKGSVVAGLVWLVAVACGYFCFVFPGVLLHLLCVLTAGLSGE